MREIHPGSLPQRLELFHHHTVPGIKTLRGYNIEYILPNLTLKSSGSTSCFDHRLNSLCHALHQMVPPMMLKVIPNTDNHLPHDLLRRNMSIVLRNYMLHMCPNVLNWIEIRRIWRVLVALHSKLLSNRNTHLLVRRSIVFHNNRLFHIFEGLLPELLKWSCQDLVSINGRVDLLSILQFKKHTWPHSTPSKCPPEHHPSTSCTFSVIDTIRVNVAPREVGVGPV
jgi:hypothetical protein